MTPLTVRGAISQVKEALNKNNADNRRTHKEIFSVLSKHAEWLIGRDSDGFKLSRRQDIYQEYKCAEVDDVPAIDPCCNITIRLTVKRTKEPIPLIYEDTNGPLIKEVLSVDRSQSLQRSTLSEYKAKKNNPYAPKDKRYFFFKDGYLYGDLPRSVNIVALYKQDISDMNECGCSPKCTPFLDTKWTCPPYLQAQVIDFTLKDLANSLQIPTQERIDKNESR